MNTKICLAFIAVAGLAAGNLQAQGTLSATATLTETGTAGSEFEYSLTLDNTPGGNPINALWYGWIQFAFDLPSSPTSVTAPSGWSGTPDGNSIKFANNTGSAIPAGGFATFTFESTSSPTAMTTGSNGGAPTGDSVAYGTVASMNSSQENVAGVASGPFQPTLTATPEPSTLGLMVTGLAGMSAWLMRRRTSP